MTTRIVSGTALLALAMTHSLVWAVENNFAQGALTYLTDTEFEAHKAEFEARMLAPTPAANRVRPEDRSYAIEAGVAMIPISGVMTMKPTSFGGCSTILTRKAIRTAAADQDVKSIVLLVNSPGGTVEGTEELALVVGEAAAVKTVTVYVQGQASSAAYWVSTYATRIVSHRMSLCGSVGAMNSLTDSSEAAAKDGRRVILIASRPLKGQGLPGYPISPEAVRMIEDHVQYFGDAFDAVVLANRRLTAAQAKEAFTGGTFTAPDALRLGLIDAIQPLDDLLAELQESDVTVEDLTPDDDGELSGATAPSPPFGLATPVQAIPIAAAQAREAIAQTEPTISAPGGRPGSAGISQAPPTGAENTPAKGNNTMLKPLLSRALTRLGYGVAATNLANSKDEDPDGIAAVLADQFDVEVKNRVTAHPLLVACDAHGIKSPADLQSAMDLRNVGDRVMTEHRAEAHRLANVAYGPTDGPKYSAAVDHLGYDQLVAVESAFRAQADEEFGTTATQGAAPQTARTVPMARAKDATETTTRLIDQIEDAQAKAALIARAPDDEKRQDALAAEYLKTMKEID